MVEEQVNLKLSARTTEIKNQVIQQLQSDIDKRVESVVNLKGNRLFGGEGSERFFATSGGDNTL